MSFGSHFLFESLGYLIGTRVFFQLRKGSKQSLDKVDTLFVLGLMLVFAAIGSRLTYIFQYWDWLWSSPSPWTTALAGKSIVGGLLGGVLGIELGKGLINRTQSQGDLFVLPIVVALSLGRVGCHLSGLSDLTFGSVTSLPWGVDLGDGLSRHPTALYEIVFLWVLYFSLRNAKFKLSGDRFKVFLTSYLLFRFLVDFLKPPFGNSSVPIELATASRYGAFSGIQWACLLGIALYICPLKRIVSQLCRR